MKKRSLRWYMRLGWGFVAAGLAVLLITAICKQGGIFMKGDSDTVLLVVSPPLSRLRRVPLFPVEVDRILPPLRHKSGLGRERIKQSAR